MKLSDILKNFKLIEPRAEFSAWSKADILTRAPAARPALTLRDFLAYNMRFATAVGLTGFMVLIIAGGAVAIRLFVPAGLTSLDPAALRAEAQAIDIQVKLADMQYAEPKNGVKSAVVSGDVVRKVAQVAGSEQDIASITTSSSPAATDTLSVDEALDVLARQ